MRPEPPHSLATLLERLELATPDELAAAASRASRTGELAEFDAVWLDALVENRVLTPYQAAEINAGRAASLRYGPYVVTGKLALAHYAECYEAQHVESRRAMHLYVIRRPQGAAATTIAALAKLVAECAVFRAHDVAAIEDFGTSGPLVWAASGEIHGESAADWMVENGRLPAAAVLHIAREMTLQLAEWEGAGIVHGDLGAAGLLVQESGHVALAAPGLRGIMRPHEGYSFGDLRPEAYDYLAPERIADGTPPTTASDFYACGALWWHLLTGRAPFGGGNSLEKLKAAHAARFVEVRQLAPDVPDAFAVTIQACLSRDVDQRPKSFTQLAEMLGAPTRAGSSALAAMLWRPDGAWRMVRRASRGRRPAREGIPWKATIAVGVLLVFVALAPWWLLGGNEKSPTTSIVARANRAAPPVETPQPKAIEPPHVDPAVQPATALVPVAEQPPELKLPGGEMLRIEQLDLAPHTRVCGERGARPVVSVPRPGLQVACDDVTFENIDFVWEAERSGRLPEESAPAMIVVDAQTVTFIGCTFRADDDAAPCAIAWSSASGDPAGLDAEIAVRDCVFTGMSAAIDGRGESRLALTIANTLYVDSGPMLRLPRWPQAGESTALRLDQVTLRGYGSVLECRHGRKNESPGTISIIANGSAFAGASNGALVILTGSTRPDQLVGSLAWSGEGSIVTPNTAMLLWRPPGLVREVWPEDDLDIAGLVRSELEFAGPAGGVPADSRVIAWQVPLRSDDPPGANPSGLARRPRQASASGDPARGARDPSARGQ